MNRTLLQFCRLAVAFVSFQTYHLDAAEASHPLAGTQQSTQTTWVTDDLDTKIAQLSKAGTRAEQVLALLGEPEAYVWGEKTFTRTNLPETYIMSYSNGVSVVLSSERVRELRSQKPGPGFTWVGKLRLGSPLDQVLEILGPPSQTLIGQPLAFSPGVLYKDIEGRTGYCYYARPDKHIRLFFSEYKVSGLFLPIEDYQVSGPREGSGSCKTNLSLRGSLAIVRRPAPAHFGRGALQALPSYDARAAEKPFQVDLRSYDLSQVDLQQRLPDLQHANFDALTRWPAILPSGFDPEKLMRLGKDPGLGVRKLHAKGFTGKGISIGIVDQTLLTKHLEYRDRLRLYEELHAPECPAQMHGPAVASIAVGRTVGVAPEADLYYLAVTPGQLNGRAEFEMDYSWIAKAIDRLLEVNTQLAREKKLRIISISAGWAPSQRGYKEVMAAVQRAGNAGVFVISTSLEQTHHLAFHGLGREFMADPNAFEASRPGSWWAAGFWTGARRFAPGQRLLVPMDCRCTASPTGENDYVYYADGGWSWSVPWVAGLYAVACQAQPELTPERFWSQALATGKTITLQHDGKEVPFGTIANPEALIQSLQRETK